MSSCKGNSNSKTDFKDTKGQPICNSANALTVEISTPLASNVTPSVKELVDGKYSFSFTPAARGDDVISIQINGMDISNSPTTIQCDLHNATKYYE